MSIAYVGDYSFRLDTINPDAITVSGPPTTDIILSTPQYWIVDDAVQFSGGSLPAPLVASTNYWIVYVSGTTIRVSGTIGSSPITLTTIGSGTIIRQNPQLDSNCRKRYISAFQRGKAVLDEELVEMSYKGLDFLRRYLERNVGDNALGLDSFKVIQSSVTTNQNFTVKGGTAEKPAIFVLKGYPILLFSDLEYNQQNNSGLLTDDDYTATSIPVISMPGSDRIDSVYIDMYLAEVSSEPGSEYQDTTLKDINLAVQSANRFRIVQDIRVVENSTVIPTDGVDGNNIYHRYVKLAEIQRHAGNANILTADITDARLPLINSKDDGSGTTYQRGVSTLESMADGTGSIRVKSAVVEDDLTVHGTITVIDETNTHSEKLTVTCDNIGNTDAVQITKTATGTGDAIVVSQFGTGYAIRVTNGSVILSNTGSVNNVAVNEFSNDGTLAGNSDLTVPTERAVKTYVDGITGGGTGIVDYFAKFTSANAISNSQMSETAGVVTHHSDGSQLITGIWVRNANAASQATLCVTNISGIPGSNDDGLSMRNYTVGSLGNVFGISKANTDHILSYNTANLFIEKSGASPIYIGNNGVCRMSVNSLGYVGIGVTNALYNFQVSNLAYFTGNIGINTAPTISNQLAVNGISKFVNSGGTHQVFIENDFLSDGIVTCSQNSASERQHWSLSSATPISGLFADLKWRIGLVGSNVGDAGSDLFINRRNTGVDVRTVTIKRDTGQVGIGTSSSLDAMLTLRHASGARSLRVMGNGVSNILGSIYWSDNLTYIQEYQYSKLKISSFYGSYFTSRVGIGTETDASLSLITNTDLGEARFINSATSDLVSNVNSGNSNLDLDNTKNDELDDTFLPSHVSVVNNWITGVTVYEIGDAVSFSTDAGFLPSPLVPGTVYYARITGGNVRLATSYINACNNVVITLLDQGTGAIYTMHRQYISNIKISNSVTNPWSIGLLNNGYDFALRCNSTYIPIRVQAPLVIKRNDGYGGFLMGIANANPEYTLDVGDAYGTYAVGDSRIARNLYVGNLYATSSVYASNYIGSTSKFFSVAYLSTVAASYIRGKYIAEGGDNYLRIDATQGAMISYSPTAPGAAPNSTKHWIISTGSGTSSFRWSWGLTNNETGANAGSDLILQMYPDAGVAPLGYSMVIKRSNGYVGIGVTDPMYALDVGTNARFRQNVFCNRVSCSAIQPQVLTTTFGLGAASGCIFTPETDLASQLGEAARYWAYGYIQSVYCNEVQPLKSTATSKLGAAATYFNEAYATTLYTRLLAPKVGGNIQFSGALEPLVGTEDVGLVGKSVRSVYVTNTKSTNYYNGPSGTSILGQWNDVPIDLETTIPLHTVTDGIAIKFNGSGGIADLANSYTRWCWLGDQTISLDGIFKWTVSGLTNDFNANGISIIPRGNFAWAKPYTATSKFNSGTACGSAYRYFRSNSNVNTGVGLKTFTVTVPLDVYPLRNIWIRSNDGFMLSGTITSYSAVTGALAVNITSSTPAGIFARSSWELLAYVGEDSLCTRTSTLESGCITALSKTVNLPVPLVASPPTSQLTRFGDFIEFNITYKVVGPVP